MVVRWKLGCSAVVALLGCGGHKDVDRSKSDVQHFSGAIAGVDSDLPFAIDLPAGWQVWETRPDTCKAHPMTGCSTITWSPPDALRGKDGEGPEVSISGEVSSPSTASEAVSRAMLLEAERTEAVRDLPDGYLFVTRSKGHNSWRVRIGRRKPSQRAAGSDRTAETASAHGLVCEGLAVNDRGELGEDVRQRLETICASMRLE